MKISIWQQFSSNHSGIFRVVGAFESVDDARAAYHKLREMLQTIDRWHREHPEESKQLGQRGSSSSLAPPEAAIAQEFEVDWPTSIDWTGWGSYYHAELDTAENWASQNIDDAVLWFGNLVFVKNPDQTWMTTQPFEGLLQKFGANTLGFDFDSIESGKVDFDSWQMILTCDTRNEQHAQQLYITLHILR